jgi:hypothetical protein
MKRIAVFAVLAALLGGASAFAIESFPCNGCAEPCTAKSTMQRTPLTDLEMRP